MGHRWAGWGRGLLVSVQVCKLRVWSPVMGDWLREIKAGSSERLLPPCSRGQRRAWEEEPGADSLETRVCSSLAAPGVRDWQRWNCPGGTCGWGYRPCLLASHQQSATKPSTQVQKSYWCTQLLTKVSHLTELSHLQDSLLVFFWLFCLLWVSGSSNLCDGASRTSSFGERLQVF